MNKYNNIYAISCTVGIVITISILYLYSLVLWPHKEPKDICIIPISEDRSMETIGNDLIDCYETVEAYRNANK